MIGTHIQVLNAATESLDGAQNGIYVGTWPVLGRHFMPVTDLSLLHGHEVGIRLSVPFSVGILAASAGHFLINQGTGFADFRRRKSFGRGRYSLRATVVFCWRPPCSNLDSARLAICGENRAGVRLLGLQLSTRGNKLVIE